MNSAGIQGSGFKTTKLFSRKSNHTRTRDGQEQLRGGVNDIRTA